MGFHLPKVGWNTHHRRKDESSENQDRQSVSNGTDTVNIKDMTRSPKSVMSKMLAKGEKIMRSFYHRVHKESDSEGFPCEEPKSTVVPSTLPSESVAVENGSQDIQAEEIRNPIVFTIYNGVSLVRDFAYPANLTLQLPNYSPQIAERSSIIVAEALRDNNIIEDEDRAAINDGLFYEVLSGTTRSGVRIDDIRTAHCAEVELVDKARSTQIYGYKALPQDIAIPKVDGVQEDVIPVGALKEEDNTLFREAGLEDSSHMLPSCTDADKGHERHVSECTLVQAVDPIIEAFITEPGIIDPRYGFGEIDQTVSTIPKFDRQADVGHGGNPASYESNKNSMIVDQEKRLLEDALVKKSRTCKIQEEERDSLEEQIANSMGEFEGLCLKKQSNSVEKQLKQDIWYLEGLVKKQCTMLDEVTEKYDLCVRDFDTACRGYQEVTRLQRSKTLSLQEDFAKKVDLNLKDETTFNDTMARLETAEEALSEMTRLRDGLADQNIIQQQEAEIWESKAHCLQGIQEGANDPLSYNPEGLLAFKVAELEKLEKRSSALLTEHQRLESASKFDAQASAATIESFMTTKKHSEEIIVDLGEQKANIQQANEGLLEALASRISDKNIVRIEETYHKLIRYENSKLGDEVRELQLKLNAANEKIAEKEILNLTTARKMSDLANEHSGCDDARRKLESKVNTLQIEMEIIPQDYEKVIKPMTAKIEVLEARLQQATEEIQRLRKSSASEIIIKEYDRKDGVIAHVKKLLQECREEKAELEERYAQQTYFRSLDIGYSECHEEALEESRHQFEKVVAERDDLLEQLSFCKPMRRFEFRDYKVEITEARALAEARDKELEANKLQHTKDLDKMEASIYNLRNLNLHFCGWTEKLENLLKEYGTTLDNDEGRFELLAWSKKLLKGFQLDTIVVEAGNEKSIPCNDLEEAFVVKKLESLSEGDTKAPSHGFKDLAEDIQEDAVVDELVELAKEDGEWETDTESEDAPDSQEADLSDSDAQEVDSNLEKSELSEVARGKQRASSSPTSSDWHTDSSGE